MASTDEMLGKHPRDDDALDEQTVDGCSKRQRTEPDQPDLDLLGMPTEILQHIIKSLSIKDIWSLRATSKRFRDVVYSQGAKRIRFRMDTVDSAIATCSRISGMLTLGLINHQSIVRLETFAGVTNFGSHQAVGHKHMANLVAGAMMTLDGRCHLVELRIRMIRGCPKAISFFHYLAKTWPPGWESSYNTFVVLYGPSILDVSGRLIQRLKCRTVCIAGCTFKPIVNFERLSACTALRFKQCSGLTRGRIAKMVKSCICVTLDECMVSKATRVSDDEIAALNQCRVVVLKKANVTGEGFAKLEKCKQLTLVECTGYCDDDLVALAERGVNVKVGHAHWVSPDEW